MPRIFIIAAVCASLLAPLGCGGSECEGLVPRVEAVEAALAKPDFDAARAANAELVSKLEGAEDPANRMLSARAEQLAEALEASRRQGTQEENMRAADRLGSVIALWRTAATSASSACR